MKIAIHGRKVYAKSLPYVQKIFDAINIQNSSLFLSDSFCNVLKENSLDIKNYEIYKGYRGVPKDVDFVISMGGDGTLLETVTHVGPLEIPILGINLGRLGFLATISQEEVESAIEAIYEGNYNVEYRSLVRLESDWDLFGKLNFGLNEFTILKKDTSSMIVVHTYIDGQYLNSYWADGLIVSTPTGSTGYSLSCGGPVVLPESNNLIITAVSPHNLTVRPLVVSGESKISFEIEGRNQNFLISLDSRSHAADASINMAVCRENFRAKLIKVNGYNFFDTLRKKLNWGLDYRN